MTKDDQKKLDEIYTAIVGNPAMGTRGLAERVKNLEAYKKKDQDLKNKMAGGMAVSIPILTVVWQWIVGKITGQH